MVNEQRLVKEFLELVQIDSETKEEQFIAPVLKKKFQQLGVSVVEDDSASRTGHGAGNLICTLEAQKRKRHRSILPLIWTPLCPVKELSLK
ncbi:peptidase T [Halalkalibacter hemicellulosilyticusJCM 9152]|uniref:Peptidase T n=1 Tax=Halalkalibacter hemicellulosilyticusJCM 9152 TaxID=1236971 RepID=W4QFB9_9BACI|nr:peptidase T [Halalkalibacter hemicellulosilyticusJCM 9152]